MARQPDSAGKRRKPDKAKRKKRLDPWKVFQALLAVLVQIALWLLHNV